MPWQACRYQYSICFHFLQRLCQIKKAAFFGQAQLLLGNVKSLLLILNPGNWLKCWRGR